MRLLPTLLLGIFLLAPAGPAAALSFVLAPGCSSCEGVTGSLDITDNGGSFSVALTLDSSGYTGDRAGFNQVGFGAIQGWTSATLDFSPLTTTTAWSAPVEAVTAAQSLCTNGTSSDKLCTYGFADFSKGDLHVWRFTVTGGTLNVGPDAEWHIGAQFANSASRTAGKIISEYGSPNGGPAIPEPSAALVFGLCAIVVARRARQR
jgi:hypothetical protein